MMRAARIFTIAMATGITASPLVVGAAMAQTAATAPLRLENKIPLGDVRGRIDHMAVDLNRHRLFVAELGNDSVGIVDLQDRRVIRRLAGLKEPQGVGYVASTDTLYVANAGDGSVRLFQGADYAMAERIDLGDDADNIRVDAAAGRIFVGYGNGALAVIDPERRQKIASIPLKNHPEAFQLDRDTNQVFVNVPNAGAIAVVDRTVGKQAASWSMGGAHANFPMALDAGARQVLVVFRSPARLGVFAMRGGVPVASVETCGDADDVFVDEKRHRVYVSCGDGFLDVFDTQGSTFGRIARIPTAPGARTSIFVAEWDRLLLAVRATSGEAAGIWVYGPTP
jgi:DNA-binding beta-propeller fold protein YncE